MSDQRPDDAGTADEADDADGRTEAPADGAVADTPGTATDASPAEPAPASTRVLSSSADIVLAIILVPILDLLLVFAVLHPKAGHTFTASEKNTTFLLYLTALIISAVFFVLLDRTGGSPGKRLFKLRTTTVEGTYPAPVVPLLLKYVLIFLLLLFNLYGALLVLVGLLSPFWRADRRNLFDVLARLRVVPRPALPPKP